MRLAARTRYGTRALLELALAGRCRLSAGDSARRQGLSRRYLEQLLAVLASSGLVVSQRGAGGGHPITRPPEAITWRQVYEAFEGVASLAECAGRPAGRHRASSRAIQGVWSALHCEWLRSPEQITLRNLIARVLAQEAQVPFGAGL